MIDVRVAEDDRVDRRRIEGEVPVTLESLLPVALVQPAIQQNPPASELQQVHRAGNFPGGSPELDFHNSPRFVFARTTDAGVRQVTIAAWGSHG
jgi:hypothetical protein